MRPSLIAEIFSTPGSNHRVCEAEVPVEQSFDVALPREEVLTHIELKSDEPASKRTRRKIRKALTEVTSAADPSVAYSVYPVETDDKAVIGGTPINSHKIYQIMEHCDNAVVFSMTLGDEVDELIADRQAESQADGYIADEVASHVAEYVADRTRALIWSRLPRKYALTERYSPGYCDWNICEQEKIFDLLPEEKNQVELNDKCLMSPRKSVTGVMGIGECELVRKYGNACLRCKNHSCEYRRK